MKAKPSDNRIPFSKTASPPLGFNKATSASTNLTRKPSSVGNGAASEDLQKMKQVGQHGKDSCMFYANTAAMRGT